MLEDLRHRIRLKNEELERLRNDKLQVFLFYLHEYCLLQEFTFVYRQDLVALRQLLTVI